LSSVTKLAGNVTHIGHKDTENNEEHLKHMEEARIAREKAEKIQQFVFLIRKAMKNSLVPQVNERLAVIKEINFEKAANSDLLGEYLKVDSYEERLEHLILCSKIYFATG